MIIRRNSLSLLAAIGLGLSAAGPAAVQAYPDKPVKIVSMSGAGGSHDVVARILARQLSSRLGQQVIVENRPGAGGTIAMKAVAATAPDGYTLMFVIPTFAISPALYSKLNLDPVKSFTPIATVSSNAWALVVATSVPVKSVGELVAYAKANPGKLRFGDTLGAGTHLLVEMFKTKTGADIAFIPYKGRASANTDLIAGRIHVTFENLTTLLPHVQDGKIRPLAVTSTTRRPELPEIPTLVESGVVGLPTGNWNGVVAPAGAPKVVITKLNSAINDSLKSEDMQASFKKLGLEPMMGSPDDFTARLIDEMAKWAAVVKSSGARI